MMMVITTVKKAQGNPVSKPVAGGICAEREMPTAGLAARMTFFPKCPELSKASQCQGQN